MADPAPEPKAPQDIAGPDYWNSVWGASLTLAKPVDPDGSDLDGHVHRCFHAILSPLLGERGGNRGRILEIGCANSPWLPYFAIAHQWETWGLDYSERGCEAAREVLRRAGARGTVVCGDVFEPPAELLGRFDVVFSWGVIEHFTDTASVLRAFCRLLAPGGRVVSVVPNLQGAVGALQRWFNRPVYDKHVVLGLDALRVAHEGAGLRVEVNRRFLSTSFAVANLEGCDRARLANRAKQFAIDNLGRASKLVWLLERYVGPLPPTRLLSPYLVTVAQAPGSPAAGAEAR